MTRGVEGRCQRQRNQGTLRPPRSGLNFRWPANPRSRNRMAQIAIADGCVQHIAPAADVRYPTCSPLRRMVSRPQHTGADRATGTRQNAWSGGHSGRARRARRNSRRFQLDGQSPARASNGVSLGGCQSPRRDSPFQAQRFERTVSCRPQQRIGRHQPVIDRTDRVDRTCSSHPIRPHRSPARHAPRHRRYAEFETCPKGNPASDTSCSVTLSRIALDAGPMSDRVPQRSVTSVSWQSPAR